MSRKITYHRKSNPQAVVDRTKQATAEDFNEIKEVVNTHADELDRKANISAIPPIISNLTTNTSTAPLAASQGVILKEYIDRVLKILQSDDVSLDELKEIVSYIKQNREDLQNLSINNIAGLTDEIQNLQEELEELSSQIDKKNDNFSRFRYVNTVDDDLSDLEIVLDGLAHSAGYFLVRTSLQAFFVIQSGTAEIDLREGTLSFMGGNRVVRERVLAFNEGASSDTYKVWNLTTTELIPTSFRFNIIYRFDFWRTQLPDQQSGSELPTINISLPEELSAFYFRGYVRNNLLVLEYANLKAVRLSSQVRTLRLEDALPEGYRPKAGQQKEGHSFKYPKNRFLFSPNGGSIDIRYYYDRNTANDDLDDTIVFVM